jgi:hypothetical protein
MGDGVESDIDTMFDEILGGFGESNLSLNDPRAQGELPQQARRGHQADDSIVSLISSYEGETDDRDALPPRPSGLANTYSSQRPPARTGERLRPLPQVPGASPRPAFTAPAPPPPLPQASIAMPLPDPFQHPGPPPAPGPASAYMNSYISPGPANALLNAHPRRQLPSQPEIYGMSAGIVPRPTVTTGGDQARRQARRPTTAGSDTGSSPVPTQYMSPRLSHPNPSPSGIPTVQVGAPDEYQPNYPLGPPPGAMMPTVPGAMSNSNLSSPVSIYRSPSPMQNHDEYNSTPAYLPPNASNAYPGGGHPPPRSTSRMPTTEFYPSAVSGSTLSPTSGATLGRSSSASSSVLSAVPTSRTRPLAAPPSTSDTSYFPASVDRANSKSSNWSANASTRPGANNHPASTTSYETATNNDGAGYLDLPSANSPVADLNYRAEKQYLEDRIATAKGRLELHEDDADDFDYSDEDETMFVNLALLSHLAVKLRDKVPRGTHVKGSIPYTHAFTGKDIVVRSSRYLLTYARNSLWIAVNYPVYDSAPTRNYV